MTAMDNLFMVPSRCARAVDHVGLAMPRCCQTRVHSAQVLSSIRPSRSDSGHPIIIQ
jgi:hypothetical protein